MNRPEDASRLQNEYRMQYQKGSVDIPALRAMVKKTTDTFGFTANEVCRSIGFVQDLSYAEAMTFKGGMQDRVSALIVLGIWVQCLELLEYQSKVITTGCIVQEEKK